jgi:hypothetical protein
MPDMLASRIVNAGDTIDRFERAARQRFQEATVLAINGRRLSSVYLYGYSVEMWLKSALYRALGHGARQQIRHHDRVAAEGVVAAYAPQGAKAVGHYLPGWALALAAGSTTMTSENSRTMASSATRLYLLWREIFRYAPNEPSERELDEVREIAAWFRRNYARNLR